MYFERQVQAGNICRHFGTLIIFQLLENVLTLETEGATMILNTCFTGAFLNVHEGPHGMSLMRKSCDEFGLQSGMTLSNEPGYYEEGGFGIRHENILVVRKVDTPNQFGGVQYLGFEHITFVPFQKSMLVVPLMSPSEIEWVNNYHQECLEKVSPLLVGNESALEWLTAATAPIEIN